MTIDEARAKAHQQYDDCMFCPGCSKLLTGLHQLDRKMSVEVRVLTSLAGAAIFYITFLVAVDEIRKDMAEENEEPIVIIIGLAITVIIGIGIVCLMDALKNKLKWYVRNKYNKKD